MIAHGTPVGDYHSWVRPAGADCPDCECCTQALCAVGRTVLDGCEGTASWASRELVRGCPCSSAQTQGSVAHTLAVWHEHLEREEAQTPGSNIRYHRVLVERVFGPDTAKDPTQVGPKLQELIDELWPEPAVGGS